MPCYGLVCAHAPTFPTLGTNTLLITRIGMTKLRWAKARRHAKARGHPYTSSLFEHIPSSTITLSLTIEHRKEVGLADNGGYLPVVAHVAELFEHEAEEGGRPVLPGELNQRAPPAVVVLHRRQPAGHARIQKRVHLATEKQRHQNPKQTITPTW